MAHQLGLKKNMMKQRVAYNLNSDLKKIKIAEGLTEFPRDLFEWCDTLEMLDLSDNRISSLPDDFGRFIKLKIVFFANNAFTLFPKVLADCPELRMIGFKSNQIQWIPEEAFPAKLSWLILTDNQLTDLPKSIGNCKYLQKCALAGNQLKTLPPEMANCFNLELLRISANQLVALPQWLVELPRLSWLGFSGNPCAIQPVNSAEIDFLSWDELELQEQLGEGASGVISKAYWKTQNTAVAVKVFKGSVTSDGYPSDELATCLATGKHANLVPLIAQINQHPEGKRGIVMTLIPSEYTNLGNPPSLDSCTRDVFTPEQRFELPQAIKIMFGIASAAKHLHEKGILHGDLYAHNTLYRPDGKSYLGDFGAASFYDKTHFSAATIERLDIRAFGCFMEDLLTRTNPSDDTVFHELTMLMQSCLQTAIAKRPDFKEVLEQLEKLHFQ